MYIHVPGSFGGGAWERGYIILSLFWSGVWVDLTLGGWQTVHVLVYVPCLDLDSVS